MTSVADNVREGLREASQRRTGAERDRAVALADTKAWVVAGKQAGLTPTEMIRLTGLARQTVYDMLTAPTGQEGAG